MISPKHALILLQNIENLRRAQALMENALAECKHMKYLKECKNDIENS